MQLRAFPRDRATQARVAYIVVLLAATLSNLHFDSNAADVPARFARALDVRPHRSDVVDAVRNIVLFAGMGAVWISTSRLARPTRALFRVTLLALAFSTAVETLQLFSPVRYSSVLDVLTDTFGAFFGGVVTLGAFALAESRVRKPTHVGIPIAIFAICYSGSALMEAFRPLFNQGFVPDLGGLSVFSNISNFSAWFSACTPTLLPPPFTAIVLFLPVGVLGVAALRESGSPDRPDYLDWVLITIVGAVVLGMAELALGADREILLRCSALVHVFAVFAGAVLTSGLGRALSRNTTQRGRAQLLLGCYCALVAVWSWRPFRLDLSPESMRQQFSLEHVIPMRALAERYDLFSATDVVSQFLLFVPVGALLALWPLRRNGTLRGILPAVYLSIIFELGKIVVAERFLDVTHILIQSAGAAIGFLLLRRAGYRPGGDLIGRAQGINRRA